MEINMKVFIMGELENFLLHKFKNIKPLFVVMIKCDNVNEIVMFPKAKSC